MNLLTTAPHITYQILVHLSEIQEALINIYLWSPKCYGITLHPLRWECYLYLIEAITNLLDLCTTRPNQSLVEALFNLNILASLILLQYIRSTFIHESTHGQTVYTGLPASMGKK